MWLKWREVPEEEGRVVACGSKASDSAALYEEDKRDALTVASHPGPLVSPAPPIIVAPPHANPFTGALCPLTSKAGCPGLRVSRIWTSFDSAWMTAR